MLGLLILVLVAILVPAIFAMMRDRQESAVFGVPCERCQATGTTKPYLGPPTTPYTGTLSEPMHFVRPLYLCLACRSALDRFSDETFLLETERRLQFGRGDLVNRAVEAWGPHAPHLLALLLIAQKDRDAVRRIVKPEYYDRVRTWIDQFLGVRAPQQAPPIVR